MCLFFIPMAMAIDRFSKKLDVEVGVSNLYSNGTATANCTATEKF